MLPLMTGGWLPPPSSSRRTVTPSPRRGCINITTPIIGWSFIPQIFFPPDFPSSGGRNVLARFNLLDLRIDLRRNGVLSTLFHLFPETTNVTEARWRSHLIFYVKELPKSPWPLTLYSVPFTIISHDNKGRAFIFPRPILGNLGISICQDWGDNFKEFSDGKLRKLGADAHSWFKNNLPKTRMIELMVTCERTIYVVLEDHADILSLKVALPGKIAHCTVGYLTNRELHRPLWADSPAKRQVDPQPISGVIRDDTTYDLLRPGVLISSKILEEDGHPKVFSTTSGILVQDNSGNHFMTAASRGIGDDRYIWQGNHSGRFIGQAVLDIPSTDVSLIKLKDDIKFVNEVFQDTNSYPPRLTRLATSKDKFVFGDCNLDSPYTGTVGGTIVSKSVKIETGTDPTEDGLRYVIYNWGYMGQTEGNKDRPPLPDGTSGSAVWDETGVITGFYHYYIENGPWSGFSASVSASELAEAGYTLKQVPGYTLNQEARSYPIGPARVYTPLMGSFNGYNNWWGQY
ncbi:hypothetical protein F4803DRAFT_556689 [Xylaria telfairii]|nr:hypothetical protein F4803DRAFT_556689 [Xylaria telfairii]